MEKQLATNCGVKKSGVGGYITNNNNQKVTIGYCGVTNPTNSKVRLSLRLVKRISKP